MKLLQKIAIEFLLILSLFISHGIFAEGVPIIDENQGNSASASTAPSAAEVVEISSDDATDQRGSLPLQQRVKLLEQQLSNMAQMNLPAKIDALQQQMQQLSGQLEVQAHNIQLLTDQQHAIDPAKATTASAAAVAPATAAPVATPQGDTIANQPKASPKIVPTAAIKNTSSVSKNDGTTTKTDTAADATAKQIAQAEENVTHNSHVSANPTSASSADPAAEQQAYQKALDLLAKKQNDSAMAAFKALVKTYPRGTYAPNAHYWLGQLYSLQSKPTQAESEFSILIAKFPSSSKVPDAMFKLAMLHDDAGQHVQAKQELQKIVQKFPNSNAAHMASSRLNQ